MKNSPKVSTLVFLAMIISSTLTLMAAAKPNPSYKYVQDACRVTRHRSLCTRSLAPFASVARTSPSIWARAAVSVSIAEAKSVTLYLTQLKRHGQNGALSDCVELFGNAVVELHMSLSVLRRLHRSTFAAQIGDLATWLSTAMTDADTCLDGFEGKKATRQVRVLRSRVSRASCVVSNALALVDRLSSAGFSGSDP